MSVARLRDNDQGLTLIELIIYVVIAGVFGGLLAVVFSTGMQVDAKTRDRDSATGGAQVVTTNVLMSIRNASDVRIKDSVLQARVATGSADWECRAWALWNGDLVYADYALGEHAPASKDEWAKIVENVTGSQSGEAFTMQGERVAVRVVVTAGEVSVPVAGSALARARQNGAPTPCW